jgi:hypothetical protein
VLTLGLQQRQHPPLRRGIEARERLIQQQHGGAIHEGPRQRHAATLAARQRAGPVREPVLQSRRVQ